MYKCMCCGELFDYDQAETKRISFENYYGVSDLFYGKHYFTVEVCPYCFSEEIESYEEDETEEI